MNPSPKDTGKPREFAIWETERDIAGIEITQHGDKWIHSNGDIHVIEKSYAEQLERKLAKAVEIVQFYANPEPQIHHSCLSKDEDPEVGTFVHNDHSSIINKTWIGYFSGKRARAFLAELESVK